MDFPPVADCRWRSFISLEYAEGKEIRKSGDYPNLQIEILWAGYQVLGARTGFRS